MLSLGLGAACGHSPGEASCKADALVFVADGLATVPTGVYAVSIRDTLIPNELNVASDFQYLVDVLVNGSSTGAASAVWDVSSSAPGFLHFQLGGSLQAGMVLPIAGRPFDVNQGKGPLISAVGAGGILVGMYDFGGFATAESNGTATVEVAAPLRLRFDAQFQDALSRPATYIGTLQVTPLGPGCS